MLKPNPEIGFKIAGQRLGLRLRKVRQQQGQSLDALADKAGVNKLTLGNIERGEGNPTLSVIWKIANGLGVPFLVCWGKTCPLKSAALPSKPI